MPEALTFGQFLIAAAEEGKAVNLMFEQRLFDLVGILHKITDPLREASVPHELVGGLAVLVHVEGANPEYSVMTRDVDVMIERRALNQVISIAHENGFRFRHVASVDMLLFGNEGKAVNAVHLLFAGEKVKFTQEIPNPDIAPVDRIIHGKEVAVISVADLVRMKLSANRDKDRVHIRSLDAAGLLDGAVEQSLPLALSARLQNIRATE